MIPYKIHSYLKISDLRLKLNRFPKTRLTRVSNGVNREDRFPRSENLTRQAPVIFLYLKNANEGKNLSEFCLKFSRRGVARLAI